MLLLSDCESSDAWRFAVRSELYDGLPSKLIPFGMRFSVAGTLGGARCLILGGGVYTDLACAGGAWNAGCACERRGAAPSERDRKNDVSEGGREFGVINVPRTLR